MSGEYALAANPVTRANPRSYVKPAQIPGNLTFTVGSSWEPEDWYYAQANAGTWTISFSLDRTYTGTGYLTLSCSMEEITGSAATPAVAVNGTTAGLNGTPPAGNDSTIARQADRSGYARRATLSFPAALLVAGANTVTLTRGAGSAAGNGLGWDTIVLEVDETSAPPRAALTGAITGVAAAGDATVVNLRITNVGAAGANDVRLTGVTAGGSALAATVSGRDPNSFPVPVAGSIPPGGSATARVSVALGGGQNQQGQDVVVTFTANGGRARGSALAATQ
jgi:rhamnogalacturonan endolyase